MDKMEENLKKIKKKQEKKPVAEQMRSSKE